MMKPALLTITFLLSSPALAQTCAGVTDLGTLGGGIAVGVTVAAAVSADGQVVVGTSPLAAGPSRAYRWTVSGGMQDLGTLGWHTSEAEDVSADGTVVVGTSGNQSGDRHAFRWTAAGGMQDLGTLGA